jgi:hypothetical protein
MTKLIVLITTVIPPLIYPEANPTIQRTRPKLPVFSKSFQNVTTKHLNFKNVKSLSFDIHMSSQCM